MNFSKTGIKCPFCGLGYVNSCDNVSESLVYMDKIYGPYVHIFTKDFKYLYHHNSLNGNVDNVQKVDAATNYQLSGIIKDHPESFVLVMCKCPKCHKFWTFVINKGNQYSKNASDIRYINPRTILPKHYGDCVPESICEDYKEACSVLTLSPQSSATLSRRILEEILDNYFHVPQTYKNSRGKIRYYNLKSKIEKLKHITDPDFRLSSQVIKNLDNLRTIGNAGAHMECKKNEIVKVDEGEAKNLLKMVEILIDKTYVERYNGKKLSKSLNSDAKKHR